MEKFQRVELLLQPCVDHRNDADWVPNNNKQYCEYRGCRATICPRCAGYFRVTESVLYGYCVQHAREKVR